MAFNSIVQTRQELRRQNKAAVLKTVRLLIIDIYDFIYTHISWVSKSHFGYW